MPNFLISHNNIWIGPNNWPQYFHNWPQLKSTSISLNICLNFWTTFFYYFLCEMSSKKYCIEFFAYVNIHYFYRKVCFYFETGPSLPFCLKFKMTPTMHHLPDAPPLKPVVMLVDQSSNIEIDYHIGLNNWLLTLTSFFKLLGEITWCTQTQVHTVVANPC